MVVGTSISRRGSGDSQRNPPPFGGTDPYGIEVRVCDSRTVGARTRTENGCGTRPDKSSDSSGRCARCLPGHPCRILWCRARVDALASCRPDAARVSAMGAIAATATSSGLGRYREGARSVPLCWPPSLSSPDYGDWRCRLPGLHGSTLHRLPPRSSAPRIQRSSTVPSSSTRNRASTVTR
jgi:hypothetical protein